MIKCKHRAFVEHLCVLKECPQDEEKTASGKPHVGKMCHQVQMDQVQPGPSSAGAVTRERMTPAVTSELCSPTLSGRRTSSTFVEWPQETH